MKKWTKWLLLLAAVILAAVVGRKVQASGTSNIIFDTDNIHDGTVGKYYEANIVYYAYNCTLKSCVVTGTLPPGVNAYVDTARGWIVLKGTPTSAGEYSFGITGIADNGTNANAVMRTVRIAPEIGLFTLTTTYCQAKHKDGKIDNAFAAGELVTLLPNISTRLSESTELMVFIRYLRLNAIFSGSPCVLHCTSASYSASSLLFITLMDDSPTSSFTRFCLLFTTLPHFSALRSSSAFTRHSVLKSFGRIFSASGKSP